MARATGPAPAGPARAGNVPDMTAPDQEARLYRSRSDRVLAGVAGGLGHYLGVDPVILRIAFVLLAFTGSGFFIYPISWLIMPLEPAPGDATSPVNFRPAASRDAVRLLIGALLVAIGAILALERLLPWFDKVALPAMLIAVGAAILVYGARR